MRHYFWCAGWGFISQSALRFANPKEMGRGTPLSDRAGVLRILRPINAGSIKGV